MGESPTYIEALMKMQNAISKASAIKEKCQNIASRIRGEKYSFSYVMEELSLVEIA